MSKLSSLSRSLLQHVRLRWGKPWFRTSTTVVTSVFLLVSLSVVFALRTPGREGSLLSQVDQNPIPDTDYPEYDSQGILVRLTHFSDGRAQTRENFANGSLKSIEEFSFDDQGNPSATIEKDPQHNVIASTSFSNSNGNLVSETGQYENGNLKGSLVFVYGENQLPTSSIEKDAAGNVLSQEYYLDRQMTARDVYQNGDLVRERYTYNSDGTKIAAVEQQDAGGRVLGALRFDDNGRGTSKDTYENGQRKEVIDFFYGADDFVASVFVKDRNGDPVYTQHVQNGLISAYDVFSSGVKTESYDYAYNGGNQLVRTTKRNGIGDILEGYDFQDGRISQIDQYANGLKTGSTAYTYGGNGFADSVVYKDSMGQVTGSYQFGSDGRATGGDIYENGVKTGTVQYSYSDTGGHTTITDLDGNVTQESDF